MSKIKSETDDLNFQEGSKKLKMLRVTSSSINIDNDRVGGGGCNDDAMRNVEHETLKIHKTKKSDSHISFSITNILQACTQRPNNINNNSHGRENKRLDYNRCIQIGQLLKRYKMLSYIIYCLENLYKEQ